MKQSNQQIFLRAIGVSFFLVLLWSSLTLSAQQTDHYVTMTTSKKVGEMIEIGLLAKEVDKISIDGVQEQSSRSGSSTPIKYTLTKQTVTIRGELSLLFVSDAMLTQLDVTNMPSLETLNCAQNNLTSLDLSRSVALKELHCLHNNITEIKGLASARQLKTLLCQENAISALDLSQMKALIQLDCSKNSISSLDLSNVTALKNLACVENNITALDLSQTKQLAFLDCSANKLTALNLSNLSHLEDVNCAGNQIRGKAMTQLMSSLPAPEKGGWLILVSSSKDDEDNIATKEDVVTAITRKWKVIDDKQDPYEGVDSYAVKLVIGDGGTAKIQEDVELSKVPEGLKLTVIATPQTGYELDKIMAGDEDITTSKQFVVKGATEVKVTFKKSTAVTDVASAQLQIYPNPTAQELHIAGVAPHLLLTLYNIEGEAVAVAMADTQGVAEMDLSHLPAGLYLLQISGELHRIVVQRH